MEQFTNALDDVARRTGFSGVVRVDRAGRVALERAYGLADRRHGVANTVSTQFATASGTKGLTALAVVSLIEDGLLALTTTARSVLGADLPLIGDDVTVEHLLAHRSGIGDYLDEDAPGREITDYVMPVPVHELAQTEQFLAVLDGHRDGVRAGRAVRLQQRRLRGAGADRRAGERRRRSTSSSAQRVCEPAGMRDTAFLRSDELPGRAALGYLERDGLRTNVFHLPVRGNGDGGVYTTAADISALWAALFAGRIVSRDWVAEMVRPRSDVPSESRRYGLGFWLHESSDVVMLTGYDAGVSFSSMHDPGPGTTRTVIANWTDGAWPIAELLEEPD